MNSPFIPSSKFNASHSSPISSAESNLEASNPNPMQCAVLPLRHHVQYAVEQYFVQLEGQIPTNLYETILQEVEKPLLEVVLAQTDGNQSKTAIILGLNRGTLRKKMQLYGLM